MVLDLVIDKIQNDQLWHGVVSFVTRVLLKFQAAQKKIKNVCCVSMAVM